MAESDKKSHWQFLANILGAKPKDIDLTPQIPVPPPPATEPEQSPSNIIKAFDTKKKKAEGPEPAPASQKKKHWGDVAKTLGIEVSYSDPEPLEPEIEPVIAPAVHAELPSVVVPRRPEPERVVLKEKEEADEPVGRSGDQMGRRRPERDSDGEEDRPRRSRRRGGRRRRRRDDGEGRSETLPPESVDSEIDDRTLDLEPLVDEDVEIVGEPGDAETRPARSSRRRRRRGRGRDESQGTDRPARTPSRHAEPEEARVRDVRREPLDDDDLDSDDDEGPAEREVPRRAIPSWQEAIDYIVNSNLANRQRGRDRDRGDRGRSRGGRRGNDRGRR